MSFDHIKKVWVVVTLKGLGKFQAFRGQQIHPKRFSARKLGV